MRKGSAKRCSGGGIRRWEQDGQGGVMTRAKAQAQAQAQAQAREPVQEQAEEQKQGQEKE